MRVFSKCWFPSCVIIGTSIGIRNLEKKIISNSPTKSFETNQHLLTGQISIIPKPELRGFWGSSLIKPPFRVTSADVVIICPDLL